MSRVGSHTLLVSGRISGNWRSSRWIPRSYHGLQSSALSVCWRNSVNKYHLRLFFRISGFSKEYKFLLHELYPFEGHMWTLVWVVAGLAASSARDIVPNRRNSCRSFFAFRQVYFDDRQARLDVLDHFFVVRKLLNLNNNLILILWIPFGARCPPRKTVVLKNLRHRWICFLCCLSCWI